MLSRRTKKLAVVFASAALFFLITVLTPEDGSVLDVRPEHFSSKNLLNLAFPTTYEIGDSTFTLQGVAKFHLSLELSIGSRPKPKASDVFFSTNGESDRGIQIAIDEYGNLFTIMGRKGSSSQAVILLLQSSPFNEWISLDISSEYGGELSLKVNNKRVTSQDASTGTGISPADLDVSFARIIATKNQASKFSGQIRNIMLDTSNGDRVFNLFGLRFAFAIFSLSLLVYFIYLL